jgi:hypothetical protein
MQKHLFILIFSCTAGLHSAALLFFSSRSRSTNTPCNLGKIPESQTQPGKSSGCPSGASTLPESASDPAVQGADRRTELARALTSGMWWTWGGVRGALEIPLRLRCGFAEGSEMRFPLCLSGSLLEVEIILGEVDETLEMSSEGFQTCF